MGATTVIFLVVAHIAGYYLYQKYIRDGKIVPESTTWGLWCLDTALNVFTYFEGTGGAWQQNVLPFVDCAGAIYIFVLSGHLRKFLRPRGVDILASLVTVVALGFLVLKRDALGANSVLQAAGLVAVFPLITALLLRGDTERPWPWLCWSLAYALEFGIVLGKHHGFGQTLADKEEFVFPMACFASHSAVALLALRNAKIRPSRLG